MDGGLFRLRASRDDPPFETIGQCKDPTVEGPACVEEWANSFASGVSRWASPSLSLFYEPDWIRAAFLLGLGGEIGARVALVTLEWEHVYLTLLQGGAVARTTGRQAFSKAFALYVFAGSEVGYVSRYGPHWFGIGAQVGFGWQGGGAIWGDDHPEERWALGAMLAPTFRYRYYHGRVGVEVSVEWPVVFGATLGTPWPILGIGVGM